LTRWVSLIWVLRFWWLLSAPFATIIVILSFILIAAQYLIALIESYIVLGAGILFLGFGGSSWTRDFTQKYIGYAVASGVKLMMILILIGIGTSVSANWTAQLAGALSGGDIKDLIDPIFSITGGAVLFAVLTWQIPSLASSMLSGSPSLTAGGAAGTALGGAALTAGAAMGAGAMASGALAQAGGMARAVGAAADLTKAQAISGTGAGSTLAGMGIAGSGLATAVNLVSGLGGQAGRGVSSIIGATTDASKGTFGGRAAAGLSARSAQINEQSSAMGNGGGSSGDGMAQGSGAASGGAAAPGGVDAKPSPSTRDELNEASKTGAIHELPAVGAGGSAQPDSPQSSESNASQEAKKKPGFRRVQPPQLPPDHAPPATVNINLNTSPD